MRSFAWVQWMALAVVMVWLSVATSWAAEDYVVPINPTNNVSASGYGNYAGTYWKMTDGSGMNGNPVDGPAGWPAGEGLPSTWTNTSSSYPAEWQCTGNGNGLLIAATNGKIGWITFDLGERVNVATLYFWNIRAGLTTGINGYNIYFAEEALNIPAPARVDYSFSSANGWTQYGDDDADPTTPRYSMAQPTAPYVGQTVTISDVFARYIGIEVLTNHGNPDRIGLAEFAVTATPPPQGTVISLH